MSIRDWIELNNLQPDSLSKEEDYIRFDEKKFHILEDIEDLFDEEFNINIDDDLLENLEKEGFYGVVFKFGSSFYYSQIEQDSPKLKVQFQEFKYLGENEVIGEVLPHLGIHSEYELLSGSNSIYNYCKKAKMLGLNSIGIVDKNTLAGTLNLQIACEKYGLKSIIGETVSVSYSEENKDIDLYEIKLYVCNEIGWRNLLRINSIINVDNHMTRHIDSEELVKRGEGIICVLPETSFINSSSFSEKRKSALIEIYQSSFYDLFYQIDTTQYLSTEVDENFLKKQQDYLRNFYKYVKPVLIFDSYYVDKEQYKIKDMLNKIDRKKYATSFNQYFKTTAENTEILRNLFEEKDSEFFEEFLENCYLNCKRIEENCNFRIDTGNHKLPKFEMSEEQIARYGDINNKSLFKKLLYDGFESKISSDSSLDFDVYFERFETEYKVIVKAGFVDYFLILWDMVYWAKSQDILVGTGRGSVVGCLVAYLLDITTVDPLKYDLLFERFLNETRVSGERAKAADALPDVDLDFEADRRAEVKRYLEHRYGVNYVCSIGSYNKMKLKSALKGLARIIGVEFQYMNFLTKEIDNQLDYDWKDLFRYAKDSLELYEFTQKHHELIEHIKFCLNQPITASIHASAVIIVPKSDSLGNPMTIYDWLPVKIVDGVLVSEWEGKYTDRGGFLKEDILGLNQLDKFQAIMNLIRENHDENIVLEEIPLDDKETFRKFKRGYNEDVFQYGTSSMKSYSNKVKPDHIEDLIAMNALFRPGPMRSNAHVHFYEIKHGNREPDFDYGLREVTENTGGLYVYQEQIMKAVNVLGGLSLSESDEVRTVMKKFDKKKMATFKDKFIAGAISKGCEDREASDIWDKLERFSGYGFNKSHSAAYSIMGYWSQWFKTHYPLEFWTVALSRVQKDTDIPNLLSEMTRISKLRVSPPDINQSIKNFTGEDKTVYWSLSRIKGIGEKAVEKVLEERAKGKFKSLLNFVERMIGKSFGKDKIFALILAGAFDNLAGIEEARERRKLVKIWESLYDSDSELLKDSMISSKNYFWILKQKAITGYGHIDFSLLLREARKTKLLRIFTSNLYNSKDWDFVCVSGIPTKIIDRKSKNGKWACVLIQSNDDEIKCNIWPDVWEIYSKKIISYVKEQKVIAISGKVKFDTYSNSNLLNSTTETEIVEI